MQYKITFVLLLMAALSGGLLASEETKERNAKPGIGISLDFTSFEEIYSSPEKILADPDTFIKNNRAWQLVMGWHKNNRVPENREKFLNNLKTLASLTLAQRQQRPEYRIYQNLKAKSDDFVRVAVQQTEKYLPDNKNISEKSTVYFTAFSVPYSMMTNGNMLVDISSKKWESGGADMILNLTVHEFFHVGYGYNRYYRLEDEYADTMQNRVVDALQNEGIATWVNYNTRDIFPCDHEDLLMFENPAEIKAKFAMVQNIFKQHNKMTPDDYFKLAWDDGVMKRAYYVTGVYMASIIETRLGRGALVQTIKDGPISFIDTYNRVADENMKLKRFAGPDPESFPIKIKKLALEGNGDAMNNLVTKFKNASGEPLYGESEFNMLGYRIMKAYNNPEAAALIFQCGTRAFPRSANLFDSLGEAYLKCDNKEKALLNYRKSLELNPNNSNAKKMIGELEKGI